MASPPNLMKGYYMRKRLVTLGLAMIITLVLCLASVGFAPAGKADVCPAGGDWLKYDDLTGQCFTFTVPRGKIATHICYKAGQTVSMGTIDPPAIGGEQITVCSNALNPNGKCCQELSHVSVKLTYDNSTDTPTPTNTPDTPTPTETETPEETPTETPTPDDTPTQTPTPYTPTPTPTRYKNGNGSG